MSLSITHTHDDSSSHSRLPSLHVIPQVRALFVKMCLIKVEKVNSVSVQLERASMIRAVVKAGDGSDRVYFCSMTCFKSLHP